MPWYDLVLKAISLFITGLAVHVSLSPPNPPVKDQNCSAPNTLFERFIQSITFFSKCVVWIGTTWDLLASFVMFAAHTYHRDLLTIARPICPGNSDPHKLWMPHVAIFVGTAATVMTAALRMWCFRTLGELFTFEIAIRPKHELITSGPYAWVRHPSYTGIYLTMLGATLSLCAPGTWLFECGRSSTGGVFVMFLWIFKCAFVLRGTHSRLRIEDEVLRGAFGESWDEYAKRVPNNFLPGVI